MTGPRHADRPSHSDSSPLNPDSLEVAPGRAREAVEGWLIPGNNPFGLYLYTENVEELAERMGCKAEDKEWGMFEFAFSDPDETLVRVVWTTILRKTKSS